MKRTIKIIIISLILLIIFGILFGTIDYIRAKNDKTLIFVYKTYDRTEEHVFVGEESMYSGVRYGAKEYYGLGYKIVVCYSCEKSVYFMPFGIGSYAWFIGENVDKLNGRWFHGYSNDIFLLFDGVGYYDYVEDDQINESGTYKIEDDKVILNPSNGETGSCTIEKNYHELHCNKYAELFIK